MLLRNQPNDFTAAKNCGNIKKLSFDGQRQTDDDQLFGLDRSCKSDQFFFTTVQEYGLRKELAARVAA